MSSKDTYISKCSCITCKKELASNRLSRHTGSLSCRESNIINGCCKFCGVDLTSSNNRASHIKWCADNPERGRTRGTPGKQLNTPEAIEKRINRIKEAHARGAYNDSNARRKGKPGASHTEEAKKKISDAARASKHQRVCKSTHEYTDKRGRIFKFDSSWEDALATRLDEIDVHWERPEPVEYQLEGKTKHYFPDFFLPEYNLYIDPKNTWVISQQREKLEIVSKKINLLILDSIDACRTYRP